MLAATDQPAHRWIKRETLAWLLIAQGFAILPLFIYLPYWTPLVWLVSLGWRIQIYRGAWEFPSNRAKFLLGVLCIAALVASYMGTLGVEPLVAFLVVSFVLKLVEVRKRADALLIIYVGFIAIAAQFLFFQTMFIAIYGLISSVLLISAWNCIYRTQGAGTKKQLLESATLVFQAMPLMVILFLLLPRLGSLWNVPLPKNTGQTGFSDTMSPGDFSELSKSNAVAFRVTFEDSERPPRSQWYWRGLVMDEFNGRDWRYDPRRNYLRRRTTTTYPDWWGLDVAKNAQFYRYRVLMEPHQQRWLFTMMAPVSVSDAGTPVFYAPGYLSQSAIPIASRTQYHAISTLDYSAQKDELPSYELRRNLELPNNFNPRTSALVQEWRNDGLSDEEIIQAALNRFRDRFSYTLRPPPLGTNSVDEFLFITQRGFCEHFASAFVVLMRAAGIPARVVVGYQGGEYNYEEDYLIVRQSDAHAWAEIWLEGRGWTRVDPTAAVSPNRIDQGLNQSLSQADQALISNFFSGALLNQLQLKIDALSYRWHQWVIGYDSRTQAGFLKRLFGEVSPLKLGLSFVLIVSGILGVYFFWLTWRGRRRFDYAEQHMYARFLRRMRRFGLEPENYESPAAFMRRIGQHYPQWRIQLGQVASLYNEVAYQGKSQKLALLQTKMRAIRLEKKVVKRARTTA